MPFYTRAAIGHAGRLGGTPVAGPGAPQSGGTSVDPERDAIGCGRACVHSIVHANMSTVSRSGRSGGVNAMGTVIMTGQLYVDGGWVDASSDLSEAVLNPATEEVLADIPQGSVAD